VTEQSDLFETASDTEANARAVAAAAPTVVERAELAGVGSLDAALREPVQGLLTSLADNKYVLGRRYAEWCTGAPLLESAVAAAAMAQDELGHARSFYPLLRGFGADAAQMEERGWQARPTNALACLDRPFSTWADFIATNVVVDTAFTTLFDAASASRYEPLGQRARKIVQEEAAHWVHGSGWLRRLSSESAIAPGLERVCDDAFAWFGPDSDPVFGSLASAGVLASSPAALRDALRARLEPLLRDVGLSALLERPLPWDRWEPARRRLRG